MKNHDALCLFCWHDMIIRLFRKLREERRGTMRKIAFLLMGVCLLACTTVFSRPQETKKIVALGKYDFYHYFTYDELTDYLRDVHNAYPHLTELRSMCKSQMSRDVWLFVINNPETGKAEEKPGFFLNQIHSSEVIASMSCNYTIWYLLANYGKDDHVTKIVDNVVWYIVPRLDVDGAEAYLTGKPAGEDPNPVDSDGDFLFDEDPPEDIDGDGFIVQMRQKDPEGDMKISTKDPRMMIQKPKDETEGVYYKIYSEGIDNDGDGKINEDSFSMRFLSNRNYPGNWRPENVQRGGGKYPMEESITRAEVDFISNHPNIAIYVQHHCCGRVILRPPTTGPDKDFEHKSDLELYKIASTRSLEHSGWNLATSVYDWNFPPGTPNRKSTQVYRDKDGKLKNAPESMYPDSQFLNGNFDLSRESGDCGCERGYFAWGSSIETAYNLFGIFSLGDEHWDAPDYNKDGEVTTEERFKWNDEEMDEKIFVDWHTYDHPTLGTVEIGGWRRSKTSPPEGDLIQKECEMGNNFVTYLAGLVPKIEIGETEVTDKKGGIYQLDITVKNSGFLPTVTEQAQALKIAEPVILQVSLDDNVEIIYGEKKKKIGQIDGHSKSPKNTYILRVKDPSLKAELKVFVSSQKAGHASKNIVLAEEPE
jgi:murein tripeptide amidase MpaA